VKENNCDNEEADEDECPKINAAIKDCKGHYQSRDTHKGKLANILRG